MDKKMRKLIAIIEDSYNLSALRKIALEYFYPLKKYIPYLPASKNQITRVRKIDLITTLAEFFSNGQKFKLLYNLMSREVKKAMKLMVWLGNPFYANNLEKILKCKILTTENKSLHYSDPLHAIRKDFAIFPTQFKYSYSGNHPYKFLFFFHGIIARTIKQHLEKPGDYIPVPEKKIPGDLTLFDGEQESLEKFNVFYNFMAQNNIGYSKTGKVLKSTYKKFNEYCCLNEFYPSGPASLRELRASMIIAFLENTECTAAIIKNPANFLKDLFMDFFSARRFSDFYSQRFLMDFVKGVPLDWADIADENIFRKDFFSLLKQLTPGKWYSIDSIVRQVAYRDLDFRIVMGHGSYITTHSEDGLYSGYDKIYINGSNYDDIVVIPLIRAMFFLLGSFGFTEIAYGTPQNDYVRNKKNEYLSIYDGLEYIRLTDLGAYILGVQKNYVFEANQAEAVLSLDENKLYIYTDTDDDIREMLLKMVAEKVTNRCYKVSYQSFLKECNTEADVAGKINFFKENISSDPPEIWKNFLKDVTYKIDPFIPTEDYYVLQVKESQELLSLLTRDDALKKYILKAENYHVLILKKNLRKVKKRLEEFGYLTTF